MTTRVSRKKPLSRSEVFTSFKEHITLKSQAATITARSEKLKKDLKTWLADNFDVENEQGSKFVNFPETVLDSKGVAYSGMELRRSVPSPLFDEEKAERILEKKGLLEEALSTYVDQEKVYRLLQEGKISERDLDRMQFQGDPSWAFWPVKGEVT